MLEHDSHDLVLTTAATLNTCVKHLLTRLPPSAPSNAQYTPPTPDATKLFCRVGVSGVTKQTP